MIDRIDGKVDARETPIGYVPHTKDLDLSGLKMPEDKLEKLFHVDMSQWKNEIADIDRFLSQFGSRLPAVMEDECKKLAGSV